MFNFQSTLVVVFVLQVCNAFPTHWLFQANSTDSEFTNVSQINVCDVYNSSICAYHEKDGVYGIKRPSGDFTSPQFDVNLDGLYQLNQKNTFQGRGIQEQFMYSGWLSSWPIDFRLTKENDTYIVENVIDNTMCVLHNDMRCAIPINNSLIGISFKNNSNCKHDQLMLFARNGIYKLSFCTTRRSMDPNQYLYARYTQHVFSTAATYNISLQRICNTSNQPQCGWNPECEFLKTCDGLFENCVNSTCVCNVANFKCSMFNVCGKNICNGFGCECSGGQVCINNSCRFPNYPHSSTSTNSTTTLVIGISCACVIVIMIGGYLIMRKRQARQRQLQESVPYTVL